MCSLSSIMDYLYGVVLQKLTSTVYKEFKIFSLARIMCNNFDYINFCGREMVQTLRL